MKKIIYLIVLILCSNYLLAIESDTLLIKKHLDYIVNTDSPRNYKNLKSLNYVADYIKSEFTQYADSTYFQTYKVEGIEYKNVIAIFGNKNAETIVMGAHYDVCGDQDGADDNASGVVGLLELARMLKDVKLNNRIELVAYTLEVPPYFKTENMGSFIHAQSLQKNNRNVFGMVSLEMIGFFDDTKKSQNFPVPFLSLFYGNKGNFITLVNKISKGSFARKFSRSFKTHKELNTKEFVAPKWIPGIDFSDHLNYWNLGYSALMITDTAFYRNKNYHKTTDTIPTLNIQKMSQVINSVYKALIELN